MTIKYVNLGEYAYMKQTGRLYPTLKAANAVCKHYNETRHPLTPQADVVRVHDNYCRNKFYGYAVNEH